MERITEQDLSKASAMLDRITELLSRFGHDFNNVRADKMPHYYTDDFAAVVNGAFVDRASYIASIEQFFSEGYSGIRFALHDCRELAESSCLADGTTFITDPAGVERWSTFSILCVEDGSGFRFAHTHSSMPGPGQ